MFFFLEVKVSLSVKVVGPQQPEALSDMNKHHTTYYQQGRGRSVMEYSERLSMMQNAHQRLI